MKTSIFLIVLALSLSLFISSTPVNCQIDIKGKVKNKSTDRVDDKTDQGIDKGFDKVEQGVGNLFKKKDKDSDTKSDTEEDKNNENIENNEENENEKANAPNDPPKLKLQSYSKYDFVPGEKVLFYEDFSQDAVGDFPLKWFTNKSGEITTTNLFPGKWFQMMGEGMFYLENGLTFPENFTLEFDIIPASNLEDEQNLGFDITLLATDDEGFYPVMYVPGKAGVVINLWASQHTYSTYSSGDYSLNGSYSNEKGLLKPETINHVSIWMQKNRFRLYMHGEKIFDIPKTFESGIRLNQIRFLLNEYNQPLLSNIRMAEAGADNRSKLLTEGKIISYGIYFDSGKDIVKPESYGTLKEIAAILTENPGVSVKIVGHTDSDGDDAMNLELSKKRSIAVKNALSSDFKIDAGRLQTDGKGESEPVSPNTDTKGKSMNRRVEFIKL